MEELEILVKEIKKLDDIIDSLSASKEELITIMIKAREEIESLEGLKNKYPASKTIPQRTDALTRMLEKSRETLVELEKNLTTFKNKSRHSHQLLGELQASFANNGSSMGK